MTVIGILRQGQKLVKQSVSGPASYSSPFRVRMDEINQVTDVISTEMSGGYVIRGTEGTGNQVDTKIYWQTGVSGEPLAEVSPGTNLTSETITSVVVGY